VIVGGGIAGSALALVLARRGATVTVPTRFEFELVINLKTSRHRCCCGRIRCLNEKSRITPEPRGLAPQENCARPAGDEAGAPTSTAATPSTSTTEGP
jgi:hypothetical protein